MSIPLSSRENAIEIARQMLAKNPVYIDTETTGVDRSAEIVEIAIVDFDGSPIFQSFVKPSKSIPVEASRIHNITNEMVQKSPSWPALWPTIRGHIISRWIGIYNADFDLRMMQQSLTQYRIPWRDNLKNFCIMKLYAEFRGEWDPRRSSYRYFSLDAAGKASNIEIPNSHRALDDTLLARSLLHYIANSDMAENKSIQ